MGVACIGGLLLWLGRKLFASPRPAMGSGSFARRPARQKRQRASNYCSYPVYAKKTGW